MGVFHVWEISSYMVSVTYRGQQPRTNLTESVDASGVTTSFLAVLEVGMRNILRFQGISVPLTVGIAISNLFRALDEKRFTEASMTKCPRCQGGSLVKTVFGTFKCPQCLYEEGKFDPPMPVRKNSDVNSKLRKKDSPPPTCFNAHQYLEDCREKEERRAQQRAEKKKRRAQDISDPLLYFTQNDVTEDITKLADIISSPATRRPARLAAIQALGRWGDPGVLELLTPLIDHQDMDIRRYAREAIESIGLRHGV